MIQCTDSHKIQYQAGNILLSCQQTIPRFNVHLSDDLAGGRKEGLRFFSANTQTNTATALLVFYESTPYFTAEAERPVSLCE